MTARFLIGDVFDRLAEIPDASVDLVITSPPFLALRSYLPADHPDKAKEIGSEATPAEWLDTMLQVMVELRRVTATHGSVCIELGDTYANEGGQAKVVSKAFPWREAGWTDARGENGRRLNNGEGWPLNKSRALIPELFRIALAYGINPLTGQPSPAGKWLVRNVVTWCRPNPPVGALGDKWRPATSDVVVACTSPKRFWDDLATRRPAQPQSREYQRDPDSKGAAAGGKVGRGNLRNDYATASHPSGAPLLDYWEIPPTGYAGAHYAVYPPALVEPLVKAMCPTKVCRECGEPSRRIVEVGYERTPGGHSGKRRDGAEPESNDRGLNAGLPTMVRADQTLGWTDCGHDDWRPGLILDPFAGSGTTLLVATGHGHDAIGIDLDERNAELALERVGPFLMEVEA